MRLGATIHSESLKKTTTKTSNNRLVFNLNINNELVGVVTMDYIELNGSLNEHDEVDIKYFITGGSGYKLVDCIKVDKKNGSLKRGK